jgi:hypothetical protein
MWTDPSAIDTSLDSRAITFENPTGARGVGGTAAGGRKGAPSRMIDVGERVTLADIDGPGTVRHIWMTFPPAPPAVMRGLVLEVFYDDRPGPSVSVPVLDFFGLPQGRPVPYASALTTAQEGRGFNSFVPMPFAGRVRFEVVNASERRQVLYFQIDYTLGPVPQPSYLHASFRRENPTTLMRDFVISDGLRGPGRFLGCVVGIRVIDTGGWYGEGELKVFRDGDTTHPTICGTGLEDYVGSAWGLGAHAAPFAGTPLDVRREGAQMPDHVGFYRWHVPDPIVFNDDLRVTIQQIGAHTLQTEDEFNEYVKTNPPAGTGPRLARRVYAWGIFERVDDYCSVDFVYCREPQAVVPLDVAAALADIDRRNYESAHPFEGIGS